MFRGPKDYLKIGDHNAFCDRCGFKYKASELRKEWQGFMVCATCWEPRHPQEFVRSIPEKPAPPWSRPRNDGPSVLIPAVFDTAGHTIVGTLTGVDGDTPITDGAGSSYFIPYGPADKSGL